MSQHTTPAGDDQRLDGATEPGHPMAWPADAGQFAARWNAADSERRNALVHAMQTTSDQAARCMIQNHHARLAARPSAPTVTTEQVRAAMVSALEWEDDPTDVRDLSAFLAALGIEVSP